MVENSQGSYDSLRTVHAVRPCRAARRPASRTLPPLPLAPGSPAHPHRLSWAIALMQLYQQGAALTSSVQLDQHSTCTLLSLVCAGGLHVSASHMLARHPPPDLRARCGACADGSRCADPGHCGTGRTPPSSPLPAASRSIIYMLHPMQAAVSSLYYGKKLHAISTHGRVSAWQAAAHLG